MEPIFGRLRSDLEFRSESSEPNSPIVVKDPITRRFFRFTPVQAAILRCLDGTQDPGAIAEFVAGQFQTPIQTSQVETFVEKLESLLLLDHPAAWSKLEQYRQSGNRILESILSIKIRAFNPDSLLTKLERRVRFCFSPGFVAFSCLSMLASLCIMILNRESLILSFGTLLNFYSVPLILVVALAIMTVHEFAHGLTLKHFGGKVEEMGFLLLYFMPAFYCNVNDAWMLKKRERLWVTFAGGFVQLFVWSWATIAWRLLSPETFVNRVCLVAIGFSGIQTLFNFNPLIKLDGYYLLSDYLEIPNLRTKAFSFLKQKFTRWILGTSDLLEGLSLSRRERRIYWRYGTAAFVFSVCLVWIMLSRIGGWLVERYQIWGVLVTSTLALMSVQIANRQGLGATGRFLGAAAVRFKKTPRLWLVTGMLMAGTLLPWELKVAGDFTIRSSERVLVNSQVEGTLNVIHADEGMSIKRSDILAELENFELRNDYEDTKGELAVQQASLRLLQAGTRPEEIEHAKRQVETKRAELANATKVQKERASLQETVAKKEAELQNAKDVYERNQKLYDQGLISRHDLERERTNYEVRQRELSEAQSQLSVLEERTERSQQVKKRELDESLSELDILLAGSRKESLAEAQAAVTKLEEKLRVLAQELEHLKIRSPIGGVVATPYLQNRIGEYIKRGDFFCEIVNLSSLVVDMPVPEKEIADVKIGYPITLKVRGYPKLSFQGYVKSIAPVAVENGLERKVLVKSELTNENDVLKAGMTGVGKILCGKRMIADLLTRRLVRWLRTEFWEYLP